MSKISTPISLCQPPPEGLIIAPPKLSFRRSKRALFGPFLRLRARLLGNDMLPFLRGFSSVLDVGCGDMVLTQMLTQQLADAQVCGVDVVDNNLTDLVPLLYAGTHLPFADASWDVLCVVLTLHHCQDVHAVLAEVSRVARKRVLIVEETIGNIGNRYLTYLVDWIANRLESSAVAVPLHFYSDQNWKKLFAQHALRCVAERRVYSYPGWYLTTQKLYVLDKDSAAVRS